MGYIPPAGASQRTVNLPINNTAWTDADNPNANHAGELTIQNGGNNNTHVRNFLASFFLAGVPAGMIILSAKFRVFCQSESANKGGTYSLRNMLTDWTEFGVTHNNTGYTAWVGGNINAAGNYETNPSASLVDQAPVDGVGAPNPYYRAGMWPNGDDWTGAWIEYDVTQLVRDWVVGTKRNYGLCLTCLSKVPDPLNIIDEQYGYMNVVFNSRHNVNPPELVVTFAGSAVDSGEYVIYEGTTYDATNKYLDQDGVPNKRYTIPDNSIVNFMGTIMMRQIGGSAGLVGQGGMFSLAYAGIKRSNGVCTGPMYNLTFAFKDDPNWLIYLEVVNNALAVKVVGSLNKTIKWRGGFQVWKVS
jgi:hypothetical protein